MSAKAIYIIGVSAYYHDSAACILKDGELLAAASEERFTRKKQDENFPVNAIKYCLEEAGIELKDVDYLVFYEKPLLKFERLLLTYIRNWPRGFNSFLKSMKTWLSNKLWTNHNIKKSLKEITGKKKADLFQGEILYVPHHVSHAAASYYTSGFNDSAILTVDGVGEFSTASMGYAQNEKLHISHELKFPHSLGLFYSAFTYYLGFKVNSAEYKVMGLAPYGKPIYVDKIKEMIQIFPDGSIELNLDYFSYEYALRMTGQKIEELFERKTRTEEEPLEQFHKDIAASMQKVTEEVVLKMVDHLYTLHPSENLCLSGGVALNCVANGRVLKESKFKNLYIFPAAGDAGGAVGAAYFLHHHILGSTSKTPLKTPYLGPEFSQSEIKELLAEKNIKYSEFTDQDLFPEIAEMIDNNQVIGLFQGRMEFGPRALGNRSIIGDPRDPANWQRINLKVKFRESFRPFAPTVLEEYLSECYDIEVPTPYMLLTAQTKVDYLPATTHVDQSARIQSVSQAQNPRYHRIIQEFYQKTKCPVIINTSFNVRGEPIVCTPEDALKCYLTTDIDVLVLENLIIKLSREEKDQVKGNFNLISYEKD